MSEQRASGESITAAPVMRCTANRRRSWRSRSKASSRLPADSELLAASATPVPPSASARAVSAATWSRCRAMRGLTTTVGPSSSSAGTW